MCTINQKKKSYFILRSWSKNGQIEFFDSKVIFSSKFVIKKIFSSLTINQKYEPEPLEDH